MAATRQSGWLVLADISGYTSFLTNSELEHAHAILEDLLQSLIRGMRSPLRLVKLEGDAVFAFGPEQDVRDGAVVVARLEDAYHAFRMRLLTISRASTCACRACANASSLDLKFMLHFGEYMLHDIAGVTDLQGPDVIVLHRLLKNDVVDRTGRLAYLLATDAAMSRMGSDLSWIEHDEHADHIGTIRCGVRCMHRAFEELQASGTSDVKSDDSDLDLVLEVPASPEVAWAWHVDDELAARWRVGVDQWTTKNNASGRPGPGSTVHCAHGANSFTQQIVGWRPYETYTVLSHAGNGLPEFHITACFEALDGDRTRVRWYVRLSDRSRKTRIAWWALSKVFRRLMSYQYKTLARLVVEEQATGAAQRHQTIARTPVDRHSNP